MENVNIEIQYHEIFRLVYIVTNNTNEYIFIRYMQTLRSSFASGTGLEVYENNTWHRIMWPGREALTLDIHGHNLHLLPPGQSHEFTIYLYNNFPMRAGLYRIRVETFVATHRHPQEPSIFEFTGREPAHNLVAEFNFPGYYRRRFRKLS